MIETLAGFAASLILVGIGVLLRDVRAIGAQLTKLTTSAAVHEERLDNHDKQLHELHRYPRVVR